MTNKIHYRNCVAQEKERNIIWLGFVSATVVLMLSSGYEPNAGWLTAEGEQAAAAAENGLLFTDSLAPPKSNGGDNGGSSPTASHVRGQSFLTDFVLSDNGVPTSRFSPVLGFFGLQTREVRFGVLYLVRLVHHQELITMSVLTFLPALIPTEPSLERLF